jgi:proline dehydrogenase
VSRWLAGNGIASTLCFWDGGTEKPRQIADAYLEALGALAKESFDSYLSIKAPALEFSTHLLGEVLQRGRRDGIRIHFDSLGPEASDQTLSALAASVPVHPNLGCTLPGRWRRSLSDADRAIDLGLTVRVVKGQWTEPEHPSTDPRAGFLAVVGRLAGRARHVAVATHDAPLAREALRRLRAATTPCELELLFGLPVNHVLQVAHLEGVPARFYVPYGHGWLPYCLSQTRENPRIIWWVLKDLLQGRSFRLPRALRQEIT